MSRLAKVKQHTSCRINDNIKNWNLGEVAKTVSSVSHYRLKMSSTPSTQVPTINRNLNNLRSQQVSSTVSALDSKKRRSIDNEWEDTTAKKQKIQSLPPTNFLVDNPGIDLPNYEQQSAAASFIETNEVS